MCRCKTNSYSNCTGATNAIGGFFSSLPTSGSFARSAINDASGVKSPLGGLVTGKGRCGDGLKCLLWGSKIDIGHAGDWTRELFLAVG